MSPAAHPLQPHEYFQMRQQHEAAERDPAWAFAPPHTGQTVTAQHHPPQGSSRATVTHSNWQESTSQKLLSASTGHPRDFDLCF